MRTSIYIETWGCQMNLHQSEGIAGVLEQAGYRRVNRIEDADIVLFNGCMVRQKAEEKVYGRIGAVIEEKRVRPVLLGVGGCLGQIRGSDLLDRFPAIDFVFGSSGFTSLPAMVERSRTERFTEAGDHLNVEEAPSPLALRISAWVTIAEGCSNHCAYCIVPHARGPLRSRAPERIVAEVRSLARRGTREVVLLGQNVNAYGQDRPPYGGFAALLGRVAATGITRIRFTSSHPCDLTDEILAAIASHSAVCPHLHLACQSGSDRVLARMNRGYTRARFLDLVARARSAVDGINVTTDLIVGFPGESDREFEETLSLLEEARFGSVFVAAYSPRPFTVSSRMADDVPASLKSERLQRILDRQRQIALEENEHFVGRDVIVLIEGRSRDGNWRGRAADHRTVIVDGVAASGDLVAVRIQDASPSGLVGVASVPERVGGSP